MIRNNLTCLLVYEDETWRFVHDAFIDKLDSITVVELTKLKAQIKVQKNLNDKDATNESMKEFARILFNESVGPYYLTGNYACSSIRIDTPISNAGNLEKEVSGSSEILTPFPGNRQLDFVEQAEQHSTELVKAETNIEDLDEDAQLQQAIKLSLSI